MSIIIFLIGILLGCDENIDVCDETNITGSSLDQELIYQLERHSLSTR